MSLESSTYLVLQYAFLGAGIKYIDQVYDERIWSRSLALLLAVACGLLMGYLIATDANSAVVFVSIVLGVALAKKIDNIAFIVGAILVLGTPVAYLTFVNQVALNWGALFILTLAGLFDEWGNDLYDQKKLGGAAGRFFAYRSTMKIAMFVLPAFGAIPWLYFFAFFAFDISYTIIDWFSQPYIRRRKPVATPARFGRRWYDKLAVWRWPELNGRPAR
jgi:hypothetical protein